MQKTINVPLLCGIYILNVGQTGMMPPGALAWPVLTTGHVSVFFGFLFCITVPNVHEHVIFTKLFVSTVLPHHHRRQQGLMVVMSQEGTGLAKQYATSTRITEVETAAYGKGIRTKDQ
jgi:hypothetical protein